MCTHIFNKKRQKLFGNKLRIWDQLSLQRDMRVRANEFKRAKRISEFVKFILSLEQSEKHSQI